jgi:MFS transporter, putative metabolite transport protein
LPFETLESKALRGFHRKLTILSGAGMFLDGFDVTVIAVALPLLTKAWGVPSSLSGVVASSAVAGMLIGSLVLGHLTDRLGRKAMYMVDLICFVLFAALTAISQNVWQFVAFRFLLGLAIGADYAISSTLLAEFVPSSRRGAFVTAIGSAWFFGAVCANLAGALLLPIGPSAWRWMLFVGVAIAGLVLLFRASIPESPRWLAAQGRAAEASAVLVAIGGAEERVETAPSVAWRSLFAPPLRRMTIFVGGFWCCYAIAFYGISVYTPTILKAFAGGSAGVAYLGSALVSGLGLIGALLGVTLVDRWGRRPLIIAAFAGLTAMLVALALQPQPEFALLVALFGLATLFANMGPGVLDFVYPTEVFPTSVRAGATGLCTAISRVGAITTVVVLPKIIESFGLTAALWFFVAAGATGLTICLALAPETKGRALEMIAGTQDGLNARRS